MELLNAARAMLGQNERQPENQIRAAPERHAQNAETGQQQQPQAQTQQQSEQSQQQQPQVPNYLNMHPLQFPNIAFVPQPLPQFPLEPILPPEELRTLTDEQLNALEGRARKNIEARIECLRNVQVLINSAIIMMQQYNNAAFSSNEGENAPGPSAQSATSSQS